MKQSKIHEEYIQYLKMCGESIANNAESIVGSEELLCDLTVTISLEPGRCPNIVVNRDFVPEGIKEMQ